MAKRKGVITLQSFIKKYFLKEGVDEGEFHRYYVILADGLRDLAIHHLPVAVSTPLTIDITNQTVDFPDDFIDYIFLAVEKEGRWWTFTRDDSMVDKTITGIDGSSLSGRMDVYGAGAVGGDNVRWFQVDYDNRRFIFNGVVDTDVVVLKYQSTGVESVSYSSTTDIEFPVYAEDAMETYLVWKLSEKEKDALSVRQWNKALYKEAVMVLRNIHESTIDEIRDTWARGSNQTYIG